MVYHAGFGLPGGFVGVDVFFVISGYLITQGILRELQSGQFSLQRFWERRIRRILPASLATIMTVLAAGYYLLFPSDYEKLAQGSIAQLFFCGNIFYWCDTGYFAGPAELKPLLHTWSLAVEEQFYLGLPIILSLLFRCRRNVALACLSAVAVASFVACVALTPQMPSATFYLLPTRVWELLAGSLIAFRRTEPTCVKPASWAEQWITASSLAGLIGVMLLIEADTSFPGYLASIPVVCTVVLYRRAPQAYHLRVPLSFPSLAGRHRVDFLFALPLALAAIRVHAVHFCISSSGTTVSPVSGSFPDRLWLLEVDRMSVATTCRLAGCTAL